MRKSLNEKISDLRKARSLTQEQLGARLGISGQAVSKWEKGESMPDILILPELCEIFGVSLDALLEVPAAAKNRNIMKDFCEYARENGKEKTLLEALSRLVNSGKEIAMGGAVDFSPEFLRVFDPNGMGFFIDGDEAMKRCLASGSSDPADILKILSDENCLSILGHISVDKAVTDDEIIEAAGLDKDIVSELIPELVNRNLISYDTDNSGKRGYLQDAGMAGVYMILYGCWMLGDEGALLGTLWFTRNRKI